MLEPELGYKRAKEVLRDKFCRPNVIALDVLTSTNYLQDR